MSWPKHGANPEHLISSLGKTLKENSIDFSVNTNPLGCPTFIKEDWPSFLGLVEHYPDPYGERLKEKIAEHNDVQVEQVLLGNGAAELIFLIGQLFQGERALIVEPTFIEYHDSCEAFGCEVQSLILKEEDGWQLHYERIESKLAEVDLVFLCHPNNPTGVVYEANLFTRLLERAEETKTMLVIDEAFYDFCEESHSLAEYTKTSKQLIVLRSMTKMYAIAGLRLGYLLAHKEVVAKLTRLLPHWNVNGLAQEIGFRCLQEDKFVARTKQTIAKEREKLTRVLTELGYYCSPSKVNYFLLRDPDASSDELLNYLLDEGIVSRHTHNFHGLNGNYLRLAIKLADENERLLAALKRWKQQC